jgi:hypothetical protein
LSGRESRLSARLTVALETYLDAGLLLEEFAVLC